MAEQEVLHCSLRERRGSGAARRLRAAGVVPGVVYGLDQEPQAVAVPERELVRVLHAHHGRGGLVNLSFEGDSDQPVPALLKDVQRHPVTRRILAVDFQRVSLTEKVRAQVRVVASGTASGVKAGGVLELLLHELEIECLPTDLPESVSVDVSSLEIGDSLTVAALSLPPEVTLVTPTAEPLVTVVAPKVTVEEAEAAAAPAAEEPEVISRGAEGEEEEEQ